MPESVSSPIDQLNSLHSHYHQAERESMLFRLRLGRDIQVSGNIDLTCAPAHMLLNRALGNADSQPEQFPADAFGAPREILACHLLNQGDGLRCEFRPFGFRTRLASPNEMEPLAMAAQEQVRLEDQEGVSPMVDAAGQQDQPEPIGLSEARFFDLTVLDNVPGVRRSRVRVEFSFGDGQQLRKAQSNCGLGEMGESLFES